MMLTSSSITKTPFEVSDFCESPHVQLRKPLQTICDNQEERPCVSFNEKANSYHEEKRTNVNFEDLWYTREDYRTFKSELFHAVDAIRTKLCTDREGTISPRITFSKFYDYCYHEDGLAESAPKLSKEDWDELHICYELFLDDILGLEKLIEQRIVLDSCELKQVTLDMIRQFQNDDYQNGFVRTLNIATVCEEASLGSRLFGHVVAIPLAPSATEILHSFQLVADEYQKCEI